jgi:hypothetical protein
MDAFNIGTSTLDTGRLPVATDLQQPVNAGKRISRAPMEPGYMRYNETKR